MTTMQPSGWYPDPTGRADQRYWDGNAWTDHVARSGVQGTDSVTATSTQPATRVATRRGSRGGPGSGGGGILGAFIVIGGGCAIILGVAVNNAVNKLNAEQRAHAITAAQFDAVQLGASEAQVVQQLGKRPEDAQHFISKGILTGQDVTSSCIYYTRTVVASVPATSSVFTSGALTSKNSY